MATIVLKDQSPTQMFMGAMLLTNDYFKDAEVRLAGEDEESNVTRDAVEKYSPSWVQSSLISLIMQCKVCSPIIDSSNIPLKDKLIRIRDFVVERVQ